MLCISIVYFQLLAIQSTLVNSNLFRKPSKKKYYIKEQSKLLQCNKNILSNFGTFTHHSIGKFFKVFSSLKRALYATYHMPHGICQPSTKFAVQHFLHNFDWYGIFVNFFLNKKPRFPFRKSHFCCHK